MTNKFNEAIYSKIGTDRLIIFAASSTFEKGEECTFERLVKECFMLFPASFSLYRYPEWPDSNKLDRPLRTLREKGWITGNPKTGFLLTTFGDRIAAEVEKQLKGDKLIQQPTQKSLKGRERIFMDYLKQTDIYKRFLKEKGRFSLTEAELRSLLRCTLETPTQVVMENLAFAKKLADDSDETVVSEFLRTCEEKKLLAK